jgi:predicted molibdopterin-dependent oxidoreductase YjgC
MTTPNRQSHGATRIEGHSLPANESVTITFDGAPIAARAGEALIAALLASGVRVLRTMPKSGEARGGYCLVGRCSDCLVIVDGVPNTVACTTPVRESMVVETQHGLGHWPEGRS